MVPSKNRLILLLLLCGFSCFGTRYKSELPVVDSSGFYKIHLTPAVNSKFKNNFSDLRLYDQDNKEVPYFLQDDSPVHTSSRFREYPVVSKKFLKDSVTQIIIQNVSGEKLNNISLVIRNAEAQKEMSLAGSFDRQQWFVVKESGIFSSVSNEADVSELRLLNFPLTNYSWYKIEISDKRSPPLDIIKAGAYESITTIGSFTPLSSKWIVTDSAMKRKTWVHCTFDESYALDALEMDVSEPKYFVRNATIYYADKNSKPGMLTWLQSVVLNSKIPIRISVGGVKINELWIEISNDDNPSLKITDVRHFQLNHYCIASLEKNKRYELRYADSLLQAPVYDLKYFQSAISANLKTIAPVNILEIAPKARMDEKTSLNIFSDKRFIWTAMVLVVLFLGIATFKMMKELN